MGANKMSKNRGGACFRMFDVIFTIVERALSVNDHI